MTSCHMSDQPKIGPDIRVEGIVSKRVHAPYAPGNRCL
jgi:hypothetical protein